MTEPVAIRYETDEHGVESAYVAARCTSVGMFGERFSFRVLKRIAVDTARRLGRGEQISVYVLLGEPFRNTADMADRVTEMDGQSLLPVGGLRRIAVHHNVLAVELEIKMDTVYGDAAVCSLLDRRQPWLLGWGGVSAYSPGWRGVWERILIYFDRIEALPLIHVTEMHVDRVVIEYDR